MAIAHNKVMILDDSIVITGSFNFTQAAQNRNAENLLIIIDKGIAQKYKRNWMGRLHVSDPIQHNNQLPHMNDDILYKRYLLKV